METKYKLFILITLLSGIIIGIFISAVLTATVLDSFGHTFSSVNITVQMNETKLVELLNQSIQR